MNNDTSNSVDKEYKDSGNDCNKKAEDRLTLLYTSLSQ